MIEMVQHKCGGNCDTHTFMDCQNGLKSPCRERKDIDDMQKLVDMSNQVLALEKKVNYVISQPKTQPTIADRLEEGLRLFHY